uniref:type II toxin-antitoxin system RelE/ParE family toxin n=1 Tax=Paracoccus sp. TRP TaxID=412597 RepID=UPI001ED96B5C|nr:type II toxin-antitoxin system RelE/ParE family toxin [Paracoccus sp. TRP]
MKALAFTVAATVDLEKIWNYTEREWGLAQAMCRSCATPAARWPQGKGAAEKLVFGLAI